MRLLHLWLQGAAPEPVIGRIQRYYGLGGDVEAAPEAQLTSRLYDAKQV